MSYVLHVRPEAEQDLLEARDWYDAQRSGLGTEFIVAVEEKLARIADNPEAYADEYRGIRLASLIRFPYVVYFRRLANFVEVLAVLHGSRHPMLWRSRS